MTLSPIVDPVEARRIRKRTGDPRRSSSSTHLRCAAWSEPAIVSANPALVMTSAAAKLSRFMEFWNEAWANMTDDASCSRTDSSPERRASSRRPMARSAS